jgi:hypothetical protein
MSHATQIIDSIERASDARPFCTCGSHTTPVWRDGVVWLECASITEPDGSAIRRILSAVTGPWHVHIPIVDVPAAGISAEAELEAA